MEEFSLGSRETLLNATLGSKIGFVGLRVLRSTTG